MTTELKRYRITFAVEVEDEELLIEYARDRYQECWGSDIEESVSDGERLVERALLEALLFSNENPSPADYGIGFTGDYEISEMEVVA